MSILFDTNLVLDVLLNREPWVTEAKALWQAHDDGDIVGYIIKLTKSFDIVTINFWYFKR